jgi:hypothetical protein
VGVKIFDVYCSGRDAAEALLPRSEGFMYVCGEKLGALADSFNAIADKDRSESSKPV